MLALVADGLSNQEICARLDVTLETVKTHVMHILQRLRARSRAHAVGIGYKHGLLACQPPTSCDHAGMPPLGAKERAKLPDSAFAYIDSQGRRRLPIHDATRVRNALARFSQVVFESEAARDRARTRLLRAASKHGIAPIGFVSAELNPQRKLPTGRVTFLLTDMEASTELLGRLGDDYAAAARRHPAPGARRRTAGRRPRGRRARRRPLRGLRAGAGRASGRRSRFSERCATPPGPAGNDVRLRIGLHRGRPTLTDTGYVGLSVHAAARIGASAHGGQIVLSSAVQAAVADSLDDGVGLTGIGDWRFRGLRDPVTLFQVDAPDLLAASSRRRARPPRPGRRQLLLSGAVGGFLPLDVLDEVAEGEVDVGHVEAPARAVLLGHAGARVGGAADVASPGARCRRRPTCTSPCRGPGR